MDMLESALEVKMFPSDILRIIDASLNRTGEGLRVLEDIARLLLDDTDLTAQLKSYVLRNPV
jgi:hypothetical protein